VRALGVARKLHALPRRVRRGALRRIFVGTHPHILTGRRTYTPRFGIEPFAIVIPRQRAETQSREET
jgi:hypothetical protein